MTLSRDAAIDYARHYWNRPCDDGVFWTPTKAISIKDKRTELHAPVEQGWEALFMPYMTGSQYAEAAVFRRTAGGPPIVIQDWSGLVDCAHFLSRCLKKEGINVDFVSVPKLVHALLRRSDAKMLAEKVTRDQGQRVVDSGVLKKGDMLGYFNADPSDTYHFNEYNHSAMYVGKDSDPLGGITCHTVCRFSGEKFPAGAVIPNFPDSWFLHPGPRYTFIHFSEDDQPLTGTMAHSLPGWWKIEVGGTAAYYYVTRGGTAAYSSAAPRTEFDQPPRGHDSAYYFRDGSKIIFIWRQNGNVAVWTAGGDRNQFNIILNGASGRATRVLFTHHGGRR